MRLRFLQTVPSQAPEYPFVAGQIIDIAPEAMTEEIRGWIALGWVAVLADDEAAVLRPAPERAVLRRPKGRGRR